MSRAASKATVAFSEVVVAGVVGWAVWDEPAFRPWVVIAGCLAVAIVTGLGVVRWRRRRARIAGDRLYALSPSEFEEAVAVILRRNGWTRVDVAGGAGDHGADVIGRDPDAGGWLSKPSGVRCRTGLGHPKCRCCSAHSGSLVPTGP